MALVSYNRYKLDLNTYIHIFTHLSKMLESLTYDLEPENDVLYQEFFMRLIVTYKAKHLRIMCINSK